MPGGPIEETEMTTPRRASAHFLLAGDSADLPRLQQAIERLPVDAYGQVLIEIAAPIQVRRLPVPERMSVTWLCREYAGGRHGRLRPRGELLADAIRAWVAEWMPDDRVERGLPTVLWIGCPGNERVTALFDELAHRFDHVHPHLGADHRRPASPS